MRSTRKKRNMLNLRKIRNMLLLSTGLAVFILAGGFFYYNYAKIVHKYKEPTNFATQIPESDRKVIMETLNLFWNKNNNK